MRDGFLFSNNWSFRLLRSFSFFLWFVRSYVQIVVIDFGRLASFKPTVDAKEGTRRRLEMNLNIRKAKKEEQIKKRRQNDGYSRGTSGSGAQNDQDMEDDGCHTDQDIAQLAWSLRNIHETEEGRLLEVVQSIRRLFSGTTGESVEYTIDQILDPAKGIVTMLADVAKNEKFQDLRIKFEAVWALSNIASVNSDATYAVAAAGIIPYLVFLLKHDNPDIRAQSAWCIANIASEGDTLRDSVLSCEGPSAVDGTISNLAGHNSMEDLGAFVWLASSLCRGRPRPQAEKIRPLIVPVARFLNVNISDDARMDILWTLAYQSDNDELIGDVMNTGIVPILVDVIGDKSMIRFLFCALVILGNCVSGDEAQTQHVIDSGVLQHAQTLMNNAKKGVRKEVARLLSNIAAGTESQVAELLMTPNLLHQVIERANNDAWEVRKECIWVLTNVCSGDNPAHVEKIVNSDALGCLSSILDNPSAADPSLIIAVLDSVQNILKVGFEISEKIGMQFKERLEECNFANLLSDMQYHADDDVYKKALLIVETYFLGEDDEENEELAPKMQKNTFEFGLASPKQLFGSNSDSTTSSGGAPSNQQQQAAQKIFEFGGSTSSNVMFP